MDVLQGLTFADTAGTEQFVCESGEFTSPILFHFLSL